MQNRNKMLGKPSHFKIYLFTFFVLIINVITVRGQTDKIRKDKILFEKGICKGDSKECIEAQKKYIRAGRNIGAFYLTKNIDSAIAYFQTVAWLGTYTDGELQDAAVIRLRNQVSEKLGHIYLEKTYNRIDTNKAFRYIFNHPVSYSKKERDKYSKIFFGTTDRIFIDKKNDADSFKIGINPFFLSDKETIVEVDRFLNQRKAKYPQNYSISFGELVQGVSNQASFQVFFDELKKKSGKELFTAIEYSNEGLSIKSIMTPLLLIW